MANAALSEGFVQRRRALEPLPSEAELQEEWARYRAAAQAENTLGIGLDHTRTLRIARQLKRKK